MAVNEFHEGGYFTDGEETVRDAPWQAGADLGPGGQWIDVNIGPGRGTWSCGSRGQRLAAGRILSGSRVLFHRHLAPDSSPRPRR